MDLTRKQTIAGIHPLVILGGLFVLLAFLALLLFSAITTDWILISACLIIFIALSLPGHALVFPLFYSEGKIIEGLIWGVLSGLAVSALIISIVVYSIGWNFPTLFFLIVIVPSSFLYFLARNKDGREKYHSDDRLFTMSIVCAVLVPCLFFFYFPFKNLGAVVDDKHLFAWLFGHDFINRQVHAVSISRGLPPESYHFGGEKLTYYWLAYIYPALLYKLFAVKISIQKIMQLTSILYSVTTAAAFCLFLMHFVKQKTVIAALLGLIFLSYSYMDTYYLGKELYHFVSAGADLPMQNRTLGSFAGFSHSLYRFFLVEPQGVLAVGILLMMISLYNRGGRELYAHTVFGVLLGLLFGVEATLGIIFFFWFIGTTSLRVWTERQTIKRLLQQFVVTCMGSGLVYFGLFYVDMYSLQTGKGVLQITPNMFPIVFGIMYFPLEYGPVLLLGLAGLARVVSRREPATHWIYQFIILLAISLFFVFFIVNPTESQFGLLKATRIIPLCLVMLTAYLWQNGLRSIKRKRLVILLVLLAIPTYFTDIHIASDIKNPDSTFVRDADFSACKWIRKTLPGDSVIQAEPNHPGIDGPYHPLYSYSLIPIFAERPTGIGEWKVSSQEHGKSDQIGVRFHEVKKMFSGQDVNKSIEILRKNGIEYVYIGPLEKKLYPQGLHKFEANSDLFQKVYSNDGVDIYRFKPHVDQRSSL